MQVFLSFSITAIVLLVAAHLLNQQIKENKTPNLNVRCCLLKLDHQLFWIRHESSSGRRPTECQELLVCLFVCLCVLAWCVASECNFLFDKLVTNAGENVFDGGPGTMFLASRFEGWYNWRQCVLAKGVSKPSLQETAATFPEAVNLP